MKILRKVGVVDSRPQKKSDDNWDGYRTGWDRVKSAFDKIKGATADFDKFISINKETLLHNGDYRDTVSMLKLLNKIKSDLNNHDWHPNAQ